MLKAHSSGSNRWEDSGTTKRGRISESIMFASGKCNLNLPLFGDTSAANTTFLEIFCSMLILKKYAFVFQMQEEAQAEMVGFVI